MQLGCFQSNKGLRELEWRAFVQHAAELGYEAIDIPLNEPDAVTFCQGLGLTVHSAGPLFLQEMSKDTGVQEEIAKTVHSAVDTASTQGVPTVTTLIGKAPDLSGDENLAVFRDLFTPLCAYAEENDVKFAFENWPRNGTMFGTTPETWDAMFNAVPSPALGLCYDPSHFYWQGIEHIQPMWDFADRIYHAHAKDTEILLHGRNRFGLYGPQLQDTTPDRWWRYRLPGFGAIDWHQYVDTLYQIGYDAVLSLEHEDPVWAETPELALRGLALARAYLEPMLV